MEKNNGSLALLSLAGGIILMAVTSLFEIECTMGEPGGVNEGGRGLPLPYYQCGVWGESFSWAFAAIDFILLTVLSYFILKFAMKRMKKR